MMDLRKVKEFKGNMSHFFIAKLHKNDRVYNITFICRTNNVIIHEWYYMDKNELEETTKELLGYFSSAYLG